MRRQHAVVAEQVPARRRHLGRQSLQQLMGRDHQLVGAVIPRGLQREGQGLGVEPAPVGGGQRRVGQRQVEERQALPLAAAGTNRADGAVGRDVHAPDGHLDT